jgi:homoserine kinase
MTVRRRLVSVPATSANLGPGFDVFAAALALQLELEVWEADDFNVDTGEDELPRDRSNLCVRAFERLHSADGVQFEMTSQIPLARGLGSSAAAIVAGLMAADHMYELALTREEIYRQAVAIEGHPDNVAAAIYGGVVVCPRPEGEELPPPVRIEPPEGLEAIVVIPNDQVPTAEARAALPPEVPFRDAVENVAASSQLALGLERSDLALIRRGLADRLHQPPRESLYPRSMELVHAAPEMGALGATISGAGPTVLVWSFWQDTGMVVTELEKWAGDWAEVLRVPFSPTGADVPEL